jgi:hypothetical protein
MQLLFLLISAFAFFRATLGAALAQASAAADKIYGVNLGSW